MGDHRASVKVKFEMHGIKAEQEWWMNWFDDGSGCDRRIVEWFEEQSRKAMAKYEDELWEDQKEARAAKEEEDARKQYKELTERFG